VQSSYPADERLMAIDGGQVWTMYQAVQSIDDKLDVYDVCNINTSMCVYEL